MKTDLAVYYILVIGMMELYNTELNLNLRQLIEKQIIPVLVLGI